MCVHKETPVDWIPDHNATLIVPEFHGIRGNILSMILINDVPSFQHRHPRFEGYKRGIDSDDHGRFIIKCFDVANSVFQIL